MATSSSRTPRTRLHSAAYLFSAAVFLFGSGYACPPPDHVEVETEGGSDGPGQEPQNAWEKFLDRTTEECIELEGSDCDGYPGRGSVGRAKGDRFRNFIAGNCTEEGGVFDSAQLFQLDDEGIPKYKAILLVAGHDG